MIVMLGVLATNFGERMVGIHPKQPFFQSPFAPLSVIFSFVFIAQTIQVNLTRRNSTFQICLDAFHFGRRRCRKKMENMIFAQKRLRLNFFK